MPLNKPVPNLRLRGARMAMRLSQSEFATAVRHAGASLGEPNECTKRLVQKWESGEHSAIRPNYRRALQAVTRIPYEQLGFQGAASAPLVPMAQVLETASSVIPRSPAARGLPQSGVEGDRLRYALTRPGYADEDSVALIEAHTTHLFELEHTRAARLLAPQVAAHLDDVASVLAGARRSLLRQKLAATGGRSAALAGWLAFDCGDVQGAHRWWDNALAAAQAASDAPLLACTLTYLSSSAADRGDPTTAWQLANTALSHAGSNARAKAWMAARAAQEAATMGERYAAQVALDLSLDLGSSFSNADVLADMVEQPWAAAFDLACLYAMAAGTFGRLGELRQARDMVAHALKAMQPSGVDLPYAGFPDDFLSEDDAGDQPGGDPAGDGEQADPGGIREHASTPFQGRGGGAGQAGMPTRPAQPRQPGQPVSTGWPGQPGQAGGPGQPGRSFPPGGPAQPGRPFQQGQSGQPGRPGRFGPPGQPGPSGQPVQPAAPGSVRPFSPYASYGLRDPAEPDPLDEVGRSVPDQSAAQVKSRALALAEVAYAATRIGELDLAREAGRLANDLAARLEVSQAKRRLRALAPLLSDTRRAR